MSEPRDCSCPVCYCPTGVRKPIVVCYACLAGRHVGEPRPMPRKPRAVPNYLEGVK